MNSLVLSDPIYPRRTVTVVIETNVFYRQSVGREILSVCVSDWEESVRSVLSTNFYRPELCLTRLHISSPYSMSGFIVVL